MKVAGTLVKEVETCKKQLTAAFTKFANEEKAFKEVPSVFPKSELDKNLTLIETLLDPFTKEAKGLVEKCAQQKETELEKKDAELAKVIKELQTSESSAANLRQEYEEALERERKAAKAKEQQL